MNIALLGGTFNPPHLGHLLIAQQVLDFTQTDEVWFLPNYQQYPPKPVAAPEHRLAMLQSIIFPKTRVCTIEYNHHLDGRTFHVLPFLPKENNYTFIIGADQLATFHLWYKWETLLSKIPFCVFPRYGYPSEPLYEQMRLVSSEILVLSNISSTKIRARVQNKLSLENFVPAAVNAYIKKHHLYCA